jgi:hypothetical protein
MLISLLMRAVAPKMAFAARRSDSLANAQTLIKYFNLLIIFFGVPYIFIIFLK